jgi:hypothetical protein
MPQPRPRAQDNFLPRACAHADAAPRTFSLKFDGRSRKLCAPPRSSCGRTLCAKPPSKPKFPGASQQAAQPSVFPGDLPPSGTSRTNATGTSTAATNCSKSCATRSTRAWALRRAALQSMLRPPPPERAIRLNNLGSVPGKLGDVDAARQHFGARPADIREHLDEKHPWMSAAKRHLEEFDKRDAGGLSFEEAATGSSRR